MAARSGARLVRGKLRRRRDRGAARLARYPAGGSEGNVLYYGDNLDVLRRHIKDESVDLGRRLRVHDIAGNIVPS
jgi:hypothetical protein